MARALTDDSDETIAHLLENVRLDYGIPVLIDDSPRAPNAADGDHALLDRHHIEPSITRVSFGLDPLGAQALHGFAPSALGARAPKPLPTSASASPRPALSAAPSPPTPASSMRRAERRRRNSASRSRRGSPICAR